MCCNSRNGVSNISSGLTIQWRRVMNRRQRPMRGITHQNRSGSITAPCRKTCQEPDPHHCATVLARPDGFG